MPDNHLQFISDYLKESQAALTAFSTEPVFARKLSRIAQTITEALQGGRKLLIAGNGGSAADAQHIAGEFVSRLMFDRGPLPAIALTTDTTVLTAIGNDYGYEFVFERQVQTLGQPGDVFVGISTSGKSLNILRALAMARSLRMVTLGLTGSRGGQMIELCDLLLDAPSRNTAVIQQIHITAAHIFCALVERSMFPVALETARA